jgi:hypothetical protein
MTMVRIVALLMIISGLTGCEPHDGCKIFIKSKEQPFANIENKMLEVTKSVELIAKQSGFLPNPTSDQTDKVPLNMYKHNRNTSTYIYVFFEDDIIKVYISEWATHKMTDETWQLQNEIADKLNQSFKDCCIIIKDNKHSGRKE